LLVFRVIPIGIQRYGCNITSTFQSFSNQQFAFYVTHTRTYTAFDHGARFVGEAVLSDTVPSLTIGIACGATSAVLFPWGVGPLVPYLAGSVVGYSLGLYQYWHSCKRCTLFCARQYLTLLAHALFIEREMMVSTSVQQHGQIPSCHPPTLPPSSSSALLQMTTTPNDSENSAHGKNPTNNSFRRRGHSKIRTAAIGGSHIRRNNNTREQRRRKLKRGLY
jgi:hypothetical protein